MPCGSYVHRARVLMGKAEDSSVRKHTQGTLGLSGQGPALVVAGPGAGQGLPQ